MSGSGRQEQKTEPNKHMIGDNLRQYGNELYTNGDLEGALTFYKLAIEEDPHSASAAKAYQNRGNVYEIQGKLADAICEFTNAITLDPHYSKAYFRRSRAYFALGKRDEAVKDYREAIREAPALTNDPHGQCMEKHISSLDNKNLKVSENTALPLSSSSSSTTINHSLSTQQETKTNIRALPDDTIRLIASHLSLKDTAHLSTSCTLFNKPLKEDLHQLVVKKLLQHVVYGEQKEAEEMIQKNPKLLLSKGTVIDYSGRLIEGTALQIALGAKDVGIQKNEECMVEMIQKQLRKLKNGEDEIAKQTLQQFPSGWEDEEKTKDEMDQDALNNIVKVIAESKQGEDCGTALNEFREYLTNRFTKNVVKTGFHFNYQLLLEAFNLYNEKYDQLGGWDSRQNNLFWRNIIGSIQRLLPTCEAQIFCQGTYSIVSNHEKLNRSLKFRDGNNILDTNLSFRLDFDFVANGLGLGGPAAPWPDHLQELMSSKNIRICEAYTAARQQASKGRVFNM